MATACIGISTVINFVPNQWTGFSYKVEAYEKYISGTLEGLRVAFSILPNLEVAISIPFDAERSVF